MERPATARLGLGDRVRFDDHAWSVIGLDGDCAELVNALGEGLACSVHRLVAQDGFEVLEQGVQSRPAVVPPHGVPPASHAQALWWERHLVEVISGRPPDADPTVRPRPAYDPDTRTLAEREAAKADELAASGVARASARTVRRKRQQYQAHGVAGLYDRRTGRTPTPGRHVDPRVLECLLAVISADEGGRARSLEQYRQQTLRAVIEVHGGDESWLPSRSTFYRLLGRLSVAHSRQGHKRLPARDGKPRVITGGTWLSRPGERVYLDSVVLTLPDSSQRMRLTVAIDELTWSVCALTIQDTKLAVDATSFLARWWTAIALRPPACGQADKPAEPLEGPPPALPLIMPERIALAPGIFPVRSGFDQLCRQYGVSLLPVSPLLVGSGEGKVHRLVTRFTEYLAARPDAEAAGRWTAHMVQAWAQAWAGLMWQHHEVEALKPVTLPDVAPTPSGAFTACVTRQGWVHLPLPPAAYPHLLPDATKPLSPAGLTVQGRRYDGQALAGLQLTRAGSSPARISVHADTYDPGRVWVRDQNGSWREVPALDAQDDTSSVGTEAGVDGSVPVRITSVDDGSVRHPSPLARLPYDRQVPPRPRDSRTPEAAGAALARRSAKIAPEQARIAYHARLTVPGDPLTREVCSAGQRLLVLNHYASTDRRTLVVTGPSGCGKSTAVLELTHRLKQMPHLPWPDRGGPATLYISVPPEATARTVLVRLARRLDVSVPTRTAALSDAVEQALIAAGTALVVIDDAHSLRPSSPSLSDAWEVLRFIGDQVPCLFAYAAIAPDPQALWTTGNHTQLHRRAVHVAGGPITDMAAWHQLVQQTEGVLRLKQQAPGSLTAAGFYLHQRTQGLVGGLAHLVRSAAVQAILDGSESITRESFDHLT